MRAHKSLITAALSLGFTAAAGAAPVTGITSNWHFDEESGQKALDSSGSPRTGQLGSSSGVDASDPTYVARRFDNAALRFDGNDHVQVATSSKLEPSKLTVELRLRQDLPGPSDREAYLVAKGAKACAFSSWALYENGGPLQFYVSDGSTYFESAPVPAAMVADGQWHHIAATYDRKFVRLYVDGTEMLPATPATAAINYAAFSDKALYIGTYDAAQTSCNETVPNFADTHFTGDLDEVRIWKRALTPSEVLERAQATD